MMDTEPGKFEGEPAFVPRLWDLVMDGVADVSTFDGDTAVDIIVVGDGLRELYPDLGDIYAVALWETEQGFVFHRPMANEAEYRQLLTDLENSVD